MKTILLSAMLMFLIVVQTSSGELVGYWDFEGEPKSLANYGDRSGNGYDMTNNDGTGFIVGIPFVGSYSARNRADKKKPGVPCADAPAISAIETAVTITGWFNGGDTNDNTEMNPMFGLTRYDGGKPTLGGGTRLSDGTFSARLSVGCNFSGNPTGYESFDASLGRLVAQDEWLFCALRFDNGAVSVYVGSPSDANLVSSAGTLGQTALYNPVTCPYEPQDPDPRQFGPYYVSGFDFSYTSGEIVEADELSIFNSALTDNQIEALFDGGKLGQNVLEIIPEPATLGLVFVGCVGGLTHRRR